MSNTIDPVTTSVIQHRLTGIVDEMGEAMLRTSYSQILNSSRDFSMAICDGAGDLVSQAEHIPVHVGAMSWAAKEVIEYFVRDIHEGDVFLLNDPYYGGSHLPDVTVIVPVFVGGDCRFWTLNRAHHSDIGGATHGAYNAAAREIWQEGLRIPPIKLDEKSKRRED
ncbi:MAG: hydantoinase B/oxoprolinase family protein, partial [Alphaproteobacteria bacterium]|nr:hydantoinase B/oxoprolinase family protein [Alphaproteobacteria bacterium]